VQATQADSKVTSGGHDPSGPPTHAGGEVTFLYPRIRSVFPLVCGLLPPGAAALMYLPYTSGSVLTSLAAFLLAMAVAALLPVSIPFLTSRTRKISLNDEGISVGKKFARWEEITEVRKGRLRARPVELVLGGRDLGSSWWPRRFGRRPPRLCLLSYPFVFREVLPAVLSRCPNVTVSDRLRSAMAGLASDAHGPRWSAAILAAMALMLVTIPFLARYCDPLPCMMIFFVGMALLFYAAQTAQGLACTPEHQLVAVMFSSWLLPLWLPMVHGWLDAPACAMDVSVAVTVTLFLAAATVAGLRMKLNGLGKAAIVAIVVAVGVFVYRRQIKSVWPRTEITHLVGKGAHFLPFRWSQDGARCVASSASGGKGEEQRVVDTEALQSIPLPVHSGGQFVWWLDRSCAIRTVSDGNGPVWVLYRFADRREVRLAAGRYVGVSSRRCVWPNTSRVCWLESPDDGNTFELKTYDLEADRPETLDIAWPKEDRIDWRACDWLDDRTLGVQGLQPDGNGNGSECAPKRLHILRVDCHDRTVQHSVAAGKFLKWRVSPDYRHVFAGGRDGQGGSGVYYLDLQTGRTSPLGGGDVPVWQADGRYAYRTARIGEAGTWLCRFDPSDGTWTRRLRIPENMELAALSPRGRVAILSFRGHRLWPLVVADVGSGKRHRLATSVMSGFLGTGFLSSWQEQFPHVSLFSGDERRFLLQSLDVSTGLLRSYLYTLPDDWAAK